MLPGCVTFAEIKGLSQLGQPCATEALFVSAVDKSSSVFVCGRPVGWPSATSTPCHVCLSPSGSPWCRVHLKRTSFVASSWESWPCSWNKPPRTSWVMSHILLKPSNAQYKRECNHVLACFVSCLFRFLPALLTAVLTNHLAWVPTVMPNGQPPIKIFLEKHSSPSVDMLAKTHPYNPLWAQLGKWRMQECKNVCISPPSGVLMEMTCHSEL